MNTNTSIQFSASGLDRIRGEASQLMRDLLRDNDQYNNSSRETISLLSQRLRLSQNVDDNANNIERSRIRDDYNHGRIDKEEYRNQMSSLHTDVMSSNIYNRTLQEMLEQLRLIRETGAEDVEAVNRLSEMLGIDDDPEELTQLLDKIRNEKNGGDDYRSESQRGGFNYAGFALANLIQPLKNKDDGRALLDVTGNVSSSMMMSGNPKMGKAGFWLSLIKESAGLVLDGFDELEKAARANIQLKGGNLRNYYKGVPLNTYSDIGYSTSDVYETNAELARARGKDMGTDNTGSLLTYERAFGLDRNSLMSMQRSMRGNETTYSDSSYLNMIINSMRTSGMASNDDFSYLNEYLSQLVSISEKQLSELGESNLWQNNVFMQSISSIGDKFQNPQVLNGVFNGIVDGLKTARTPQVEALQFEVLSQLNPGASLWELEKMRENPTAHPEYLSAMMKRIEELSGGDKELMSRNFSEVFFQGDKKQISEDLMTKGDFISKFKKTLNSDNSGFNTSDVWDRARQSTTSEEVRNVGVVSEVRQTLSSRTNELIESLHSSQTVNNQRIEELNRSVESLNTTTGKLERATRNRVK